MAADRDWLFSRSEWSKLQGLVRPAGSSSRLEPDILLPESYRQLNDHVYEVCKPPTGKRPSVEIVFFHGLQFEYTSAPHITTWLSRGKTTLWLTWLPEEHSNARILTVSYDASPKKTYTRGRTDMYVTCENLIACLTDSRAALGDDGCPIILVGHCLGGLVMKELLVKAHFMLGRSAHQEESIRNFLTSVKAIFFYATPHHGSYLPSIRRGFREGPLFSETTLLNPVTERRNEDFRRLRQAYGWISAGVGETQVVKLGNFKDLIVAEASARCDIDDYYTIHANHFDVCRPESTVSGSFQRLSNLILTVLKEDETTAYSSTGLQRQTVGLKTPLNTIEKKLFGGHSVTPRFGIVGIGGIGKTMLAEMLFDRISGRFEYACFVREIKRLMGGGETTNQLHEIIVEKLTRKGRLVDRRFQWSALKGKRVLIVLDDAESGFHTRVMTEEDSFSEDSVVIVTSRNKRFLEPQGFTIHEMETLGRQDSEKLLCRHAFKREVAPSDFGEQVTKVASLCGGLPLALEVAGGYLYNQEEAIWDDVCKMLVEVYPIGGSTLEECRLWSILKKTYDSLGSIEKQMFLDIATCLDGEYTVDVKNMWNFRGWAYVNAGWQNLLDRCLVKLIKPPPKRLHGKLSGDEAVRISMHELLRNLGRDTALANETTNKEPARVFEVNKANELLTEKSTVEILKLNIRGYQSFDMRVLHGLMDLRVLWLSSTQSKERWGTTTLQAFEDSFSERPSRLFVMTTTYPWKAIITLYRQFISGSLFPAQLAYVRLYQADALKLQQICKIQALRCLVLDYPTIEQLPRSLSQLRQLEHLEIISCFSLKAIPAEIGLLHKLHFLLLDHCGSLEVLPHSITDLTALKVLNINYCPQLMVLLACFQNLPALKDLNVRNCVVESWYELTIRSGSSDGYLMYLKSIKFRDFHHLNGTSGVGVHVWDEGSRTSSYFCDLGGSFESCQQIRRLKRLEIEFIFGEVPNLDLQCFQALEELRIDGSIRSECHILTKVKTLPDSIGSLLKLRLLAIHDLWDLEILPDTLGQLQSLETLIVHGCRCLRYFPESIGQLVALQKLEIFKCKTLTTLPNSTGNVQTLETLTVDRCPSMKNIPESVWQLTALQKLTIINCKSLKIRPNTAWNLRALREIELDMHSPDSSSISFLKVLGDRVLHYFALLPWSTGAVHSGTKLLDAAITGQLPALRCLKVRDYNLHCLPPALGDLQRLSQLTIRCENVIDLEPVWQLRELKCLRLEACRRVMDLDSVKHLRALTHLDLIGLDIVALPACVGHLGALKHLFIKDCIDLEELPESVGYLGDLEHLEIHGVGVTYLPESVGQLGSLKTLIVCYCFNLAKLPESLHQLQLLNHLEIALCHNLADLHEKIGELTTLKTLILRSLPKLAKLPASMWHLQNLECLTIESFEKLETLPEFNGQLRALQVLRIRWCDNLLSLPHFAGQLGPLRVMEITSCKKMAGLPESFGQLAQLTIDNCTDLEEWRPTLSQVGRLQQLEFKTYALYSTLKGTEDEQLTTTVFSPQDLQQLVKENKSLIEFATVISRAYHVV